MRHVIASLALLVAVGCCKPKTIVVQAPPPPVVAEPEIRVAKLPADASVKMVIEAYVLGHAEWVAYARRLEILLWGKTTQPQPAPQQPELPK